MLNDNERKVDFSHKSIVGRLTSAKIEKTKAKAFAKEFTNGMNLSYSKEYLDYKFRGIVSDMEVSLAKLRTEVLRNFLLIMTLQTLYLSILALLTA